MSITVRYAIQYFNTAIRESKMLNSIIFWRKNTGWNYSHEETHETCDYGQAIAGVHGVVFLLMSSCRNPAWFTSSVFILVLSDNNALFRRPTYISTALLSLNTFWEFAHSTELVYAARARTCKLRSWAGVPSRTGRGRQLHCTKTEVIVCHDRHSTTYIKPFELHPIYLFAVGVILPELDHWIPDRVVPQRLCVFWVVSSSFCRRANSALTIALKFLNASYSEWSVIPAMLWPTNKSWIMGYTVQHNAALVDKEVTSSTEQSGKEYLTWMVWHKYGGGYKWVCSAFLPHAYQASWWESTWQATEWKFYYWICRFCYGT